MKSTASILVCSSLRVVLAALGVVVGLVGGVKAGGQAEQGGKGGGEDKQFVHGDTFRKAGRRNDGHPYTLLRVQDKGKWFRRRSATGMEDDACFW